MNVEERKNSGVHSSPNQEAELQECGSEVQGKKSSLHCIKWCLSQLVTSC
jgi:hypothetical protein